MVRVEEVGLEGGRWRVEGGRWKVLPIYKRDTSIGIHFEGGKLESTM